jgi:hypothetical protein
MELRRYAPRFEREMPEFPRLADSGGPSQRLSRHNFDSIVSWHPTARGHVVYGWTDLALDHVSASTSGSTLRRQPGAPGVLLDSVTLKLGPPPLGFFQADGTTVSLVVDAVGAHTFSGHWEASGWLEPIDPTTHRAVEYPSGTFCASRDRASAT